MNIYPFMRDERYIAIAKEYLEAMKKANQQRKNEVKPDRIKADATNAQQQLQKKLEQFYRDKVREYTKEKEKIEHTYKNQKNNYSNPSEEILRRQDFDAKVSVASDRELEGILSTRVSDLSEYEFNRLQLEYKKRELNETQFNVYRTVNNVGKEHQNDPNYQQIDQEEQWLHLIRPQGISTNLWFPNEDGRLVLSLNEIEKAGSNLFQERKITEAANGLNVMSSNVQSYKEWTSTLRPTLENEVNEFVTEGFKQGKKFNVKQYDDADPRAIEGAKEYAIEHEYKYLKERYNEPNNYMYSLDNPDFDIVKHLAFLRNKHQQSLASNPELEQAIKTVAEAKVGTEEDIEE